VDGWETKRGSVVPGGVVRSKFRSEGDASKDVVVGGLRQGAPIVTGVEAAGLEDEVLVGVRPDEVLAGAEGV
jgi:hypothetical protein